MQRFKTTIGNLMPPSNIESWPELRDPLNSSLLGWSNYFCHGTRRSAFRSINRYVYERVRDFLARRHKVAGRGTSRFSCDFVYGELGLPRLERLPLAAPAKIGDRNCGIARRLQRFSELGRIDRTEEDDPCTSGVDARVKIQVRDQRSTSQD
jgi:hypothetical protein